MVGGDEGTPNQKRRLPSGGIRRKLDQSRDPEPFNSAGAQRQDHGKAKKLRANLERSKKKKGG